MLKIVLMIVKVYQERKEGKSIKILNNLKVWAFQNVMNLLTLEFKFASGCFRLKDCIIFKARIYVIYVKIIS